MTDESLSTLLLHWQPIVSSVKGRTSLAREALCRFPMPGGGVSGPAGFLASDPDGSAGRALDRAVLDSAGRTLARHPDLIASINVMKSSLSDPAWQEALDRRVLQPGRASRVILEINERGRLDEAAVRGALACRQAGCRLALDDFGAGESAFSDISRLRPDFLKLDITLSRAIARDPSRIVPVRKAAQAAGARMIAEGVETPREFRTLAQAGIPYLQGFLTGRPAPLSTALRPHRRTSRQAVDDAPEI